MKSILTLCLCLCLFSVPTLASTNNHYFNFEGEEVVIQVVGSIFNPRNISFSVNCDRVNCYDSQFSERLLKSFIYTMKHDRIYTYKIAYGCPINDPRCSSMESIKAPGEREFIDVEIPEFPGSTVYSFDGGIEITHPEQSVILLDDEQSIEASEERGERVEVKVKNFAKGIFSGIGIFLANTGITEAYKALTTDKRTNGKILIFRNKANKAVGICVVEGDDCKEADYTVVNHSDGSISVGSVTGTTAENLPIRHAIETKFWTLGGYSWKCYNTGTSAGGPIKWTLTCGYWP